MGIASRRLRRVQEALLSGCPRQARALTRLYGRKAAAEERARLRLYEASALLWEGKHARAAMHADALATLPGRDVLGVLPLVVKLEALIFEERVAEARDLFAANESALRASRLAPGDVTAIGAMLRFADGDIETARAELRRVFVLTGPLDPVRRVAHFVLAAIAQRNGDLDKARAHLDAAIEFGGELFIVRWAKSKRSELFPSRRAPRVAAGAVGRALAALGVGIRLAFLRTASLRRHTFSFDHVLALAIVDAILIVGLRALQYERGATPYWIGFLALLAPLPGVALAARIAAGTVQRAALRIAGGFYAALPVFIIVGSALARSRFGEPASQSGALVSLLVWSTVVLAAAVRASRRVRPLRFGGALLVFAGTFAIPFYAVNDAWVFYPPVRAHRVRTEDVKRREALVFSQVEELQAAESKLHGERSGVTDLYFIGGAGYAEQDVFGRDVRYARNLLDERFDTAGRSIVLVNDPFGLERAPLAAAVSLRHVIRSVGAKMNRDEDVLFLYLTSHGSEDGLALTFPEDSAFRRDTLTPSDVRSMLDEAGVRWRILVIAGCESGVFLRPLSSDTSIVATASAPDRASYGCAMGNEQTDFGRAVFADHLRRDGTFVSALRGAIADVDAQETKDGRTPSRPQLSVGVEVEKKLAELEQRLVVTAAPESR